MRTKLDITSGIFPMPVLMIATYNEDGSVNVMNAAWGTMQSMGNVVLRLTETHKTVKNIKAKGAFTVSFATADTVAACDYVGLVTANTTSDKMEKAGFHTVKSEFVDAPIIEELPMTLECKLVKIGEDGHIIGEVVNVSVDEKILGDDGLVLPEKLGAITFDPVHNTYLKLGEKVGNAFSDGKKLK